VVLFEGNREVVVANAHLPIEEIVDIVEHKEHMDMLGGE